MVSSDGCVSQTTFLLLKIKSAASDINENERRVSVRIRIMYYCTATYDIHDHSVLAFVCSLLTDDDVSLSVETVSNVI